MSGRRAKAGRKEGKVEVIAQVGPWSVLRLTNPRKVTSEQIAVAVGDEDLHILDTGWRFAKGLKTFDILHYFDGDDPREEVNRNVNAEAGVILRHLEVGGGLGDDALRSVMAPVRGEKANDN